MRKIFILLALAMATLTVQTTEAQVKFGLKGGLNITTMSLGGDVLNVSNRTGFFIGPTVKFSLPVVGLGVDASALYDQREAEVEATGDDGSTATATLKQRAINVPVNLRYGFGLGDMASLYLAAGPQFGFNVGGKSKSIYGSDGSWTLKSSTFSVNVGAGLMLLGHLQVGANYNIVCGKTGDVTVFDTVKKTFRGRANTWQISAAYYF